MIKITEMAYSNTKDARILESCLKNWFSNPKDLQLTSPNSRFPFQFNKWLIQNYQKPGITTWVAKKDTWIVGHMSIIHRPKTNSFHMFHIIVDKDFRKQGIGEKLVKFGISLGKRNKHDKITLRVMKKNVPAYNLYLKLGFELTGARQSSLEMEMNLKG